MKNDFNTDGKQSMHMKIYAIIIMHRDMLCTYNTIHWPMVHEV